MEESLTLFHREIIAVIKKNVLYCIKWTEMKKFLLIYVGILYSVLAFGQTNFQKLTLNEACEKAKAEGKMVFVDLYT